MGRVLKLNDKIVRQIVYDYTINLKSMYYLTSKYHLSQDKIEKTLKENGVILRTYAVAKNLSRKYKLNDDFFKVQSHDMAYILGLIAADGNVGFKENSISIELVKDDSYILNQIQELVESDRPIKYYIHKHPDRKDVETATFKIWSSSWKKDLSIYNIVPNKTFILQPPTFLAKEYWISYIKGYFDGDGSINLTKRNNLNLSIVGASKDLIKWMYSFLVNNYGLIGSFNTYKTQNNVIMYRISFESKKDISTLYNEWYIKNKSNLYLKRKKDIFNLKNSL